MKTTYVRFILPGLIFANYHDVKSNGEPVVPPKDAYGWYLIAREEVIDEATGDTLCGPWHDNPHTQVIAGRAYTVTDLQRDFSGDEHRTLLANVVNNEYKGAIHTVAGNWCPWYPDMTVIPEMPATVSSP